MPNLSTRDWTAGILKELPEVIEIDPVANDFIRIQRRNPSLRDETYSPVVTAIISERRVSESSVTALFGQGHDFQFVTNIPKNAVWTGEAICSVEQRNLGWGGFGELMSALGQPYIEGFQKKEYTFVMDGLNQHKEVDRIDRLYDRVVDINRFSLPNLKTVMINEYGLTAEHIRHFRQIYGDFSAILLTNPNGHITTNARTVATSLGAEIFMWGEFLGRLNRE